MRRLAALLLLVGTGCASSVGTGGARVLDGGKQTFGLGLDITLPSARIEPSSPVAGIWPQFSLGYRRGLGGNVEIGARTWAAGIPRYVMTLGGGADVRYGLVKSPSPEEGLDLALGAGVGYHQINAGGVPTHVMVTQVPLLGGINLEGGHQIFGGPRFEHHYMTGPDVNPVHLPFFGGSIGFSWRAASFLEVRPQIVAMYSPVSFNGTQDPDGRRGVGILQFGLSNAILPEGL